MNDNQVYRALAKVEARFKSFGSFLVKVGGGLVAAGTAGLTALTGIFSETIDHFDAINKAADRTGATTEALSALGYAAEQSGANLEDVEVATKKLSRTLTDAADGSKTAQESLAKLGLTIDDLKDLPLEEQFALIADGLNSLPSGAARTAAALDLFGKSGTRLLPLLKGGGAGLRELLAEAQDVGAVVSGENADKATRSGDALMRVWTAIKNTFRAVAAAFLPLVDEFEAFVKQVVKILIPVRAWIAENRQAIQTVAAVAAGLIVAGGVIAGVGVVIYGIGTAIGVAVAAFKLLAAGIALVISPVGLAVVALTALVAGLVYLYSTTSEGQAFFARLAAGFVGVAQTAKAAFGGIKDALFVGDWTLAFQILVTALVKEFAQGEVFLTEIWNDFKGFFVDGWYDAIKLLQLAWNDFDHWFERIILDIAEFALTHFEKVFRAFMNLVADAIGQFDSGFAASLRAIANAPKGKLLGAIDSLRQKSFRDQDKQARKIEDEAADAQDKRDAARAEDLNAAKNDVERFGRILNYLIGKAGAEAAKKMAEQLAGNLLSNLVIPILFGNMRARRGQLAGLGDSVKGGFGGANASGQFAFGDRAGKAAIDTAKNTADLVELAKVTNDKLDNLEGAVFT